MTDAFLFHTLGADRVVLADILAAAIRDDFPVFPAQTVPHLHLHLIPQCAEDRDDPRGGVRWMFQKKADYRSQR